MGEGRGATVTSWGGWKAVVDGERFERRSPQDLVDEGEGAPRPVLKGRGRRAVLQGRSLGQVRGWLWAEILGGWGTWQFPGTNSWVQGSGLEMGSGRPQT